MTQEQTQIRRFDMFARDDGHNSPWIEQETSEDGDYCLWEDVESEMARLNAEIERLRGEIRASEWATFVGVGE